MRTIEEYKAEFQSKKFEPYIKKLNPRTKTAQLTVSEYDDLTFDQLQVVSEVFGTKNINLSSETEHHGGCESCAFSTTNVVIKVEDITR